MPIPAGGSGGTPVDSTPEIASLRAKINEPTEDTYTDEYLQARLDAAGGDIDKVAGQIWTEKAGRFSTLVNVSESGSSRSMGDLYKNAIAMAKLFGDQAAAEVVVPADRPRTRAIERL